MILEIKAEQAEFKIALEELKAEQVKFKIALEELKTAQMELRADITIKLQSFTTKMGLSCIGVTCPAKIHIKTYLVNII